MNGTIRRVCRNVKRWNDASMALRWTGAAMREAAKGFRRLKACKDPPALRGALAAHQIKHTMKSKIEDRAGSVGCSTSDACRLFGLPGMEMGNQPAIRGG